MNYQQFLESKRIMTASAGITVSPEDINPILYPWQRDIVCWALRKGRAALFEDCGLGKTFQQLEWGRLIHLLTGGDVLILAPLAVSKQTKREALKLGMEITICRTQADVKPGINITNYEMLNHFDPDKFAGIVLDESSILKAFSGKYRQEITRFGSVIPYRLACTATPAPNDLIEITNHAEFLGTMRGKEIIALFFTQDGNTTHAWRLKGHAKKDFWTWVASWCVAIRKPSDLGYPDDKFILPKLNLIEHILEVENFSDRLFVVEAETLEGRRRARQLSTKDRVAEAA